MNEIEILNYAQMNFIQNGLYMVAFTAFVFITFRLIRFQREQSLEKKSKTKIKSPKQEISKIGIRAEAISITDINNPDLFGKLVLCEYLGSEQFAYVDCGNGILITVRVEPTIEIKIGSEIGLNLNPSSVHFFSESGLRIEP